jgi:hypothetical protein
VNEYAPTWAVVAVIGLILSLSPFSWGEKERKTKKEKTNRGVVVFNSLEGWGVKKYIPHSQMRNGE